MLTDRYDLVLSTASSTAGDAYVQASDLALTFYPGAAEAYDRAIAADPGFALAYAGKAQVLMRQGDVEAARAALAAAKEVSASLSEREASHIGFFDHVFAGRTEAAIAALYGHLAAWPRDALVVSVGANPNGLIGGSGRIGQKHQIAVLMDSLAPHYGDDFWFTSYHALALSEDGQLAMARAKVERSLAANPNNAHGAHGFAHVCYENGEPDTARAFLSSWLATYPREGFFYGHLSWHQSLCEIQTGNWEEALRLYRDALALDRHSGGPQQKISDGAAFCGVPNSPVSRATPRRGAGCMAMRTAHCQGRATGSLIRMFYWCRLSWEMMPRSMPVPDRCTIWRARGVTPRVLTFLHWRAALRRSSGRIFPARSRRWRRWRAKTNALAAAAHSTT